MIKETCDECNKEVRRGTMNIVSCSIEHNKSKYVSTIKLTHFNNNNKNRRYPHKQLCKDCSRYYYESLQTEEMKNLISMELLSLISGKAHKVKICDSLEEGNGE